jgi:hypothetical protein
MTQHSSLTTERWSAFTLDQQILMIGNEMNRAKRSAERGDTMALKGSYERVLRLVDLTVQVQKRYGLRRELLRWRDLVAEMYLQPEPDPAQHAAIFRILLQLTPEAARQIPFVLPSPGRI